MPAGREDLFAVQEEGQDVDRRNASLWMREVLDHLNRCYDQWQAGDIRLEGFAIESIERDLTELQRICQAARQGQKRPELLSARAA